MITLITISFVLFFGLMMLSVEPLAKLRSCKHGLWKSYCEKCKNKGDEYDVD